ncbi:hypothetical protein GF362_05770 [Candidatus Dojkabacteria bacterium]|nr:hypothetical protein [Candidatus Dojkabacteria bacterium]
MANSSTQQHLAIEDIRNDLVILRNGNVALVMECTALNFDLLSESEQDGRITAFAGLMNSLTFPIQIVIHTQRTDVTKYIEKLRSIQSRHTSVALKRQIEIYIKFIKNLTINNEVLDKRFFIVIPALLGAVQRPSFIQSIFGKQKEVSIDIDKILTKAQLELYPKRDHMLRQIKKMGLAIKQLNTDDLIRLYYSMYDPDKVGYNRLSITKQDFTASMVTPMKEEATDSAEPYQEGNSS